MMAAAVLSADCLGWVRAAIYSCVTEDADTTMLRCEGGPSTRYYIRRRGADRLELASQADEDGVEHPVLFVGRIEVLERYLFGDDIREDLDLPPLDLPWAADEFAVGFGLSEMVRGYRTLSRFGAGPVAAAPDPTLSLLVALSHFLGCSVPDLNGRS
jgi:hypothetical protein